VIEPQKNQDRFLRNLSDDRLKKIFYGFFWYFLRVTTIVVEAACGQSAGINPSLATASSQNLGLNAQSLEPRHVPDRSYGEVSQTT